MTEIEIATGAAIAAQAAVDCAREVNEDYQKYSIAGSRIRSYVDATAPFLEEAYEALELAVKKLLKAKELEAESCE